MLDQRRKGYMNVIQKFCVYCYITKWYNRPFNPLSANHDYNIFKFVLL